MPGQPAVIIINIIMIINIIHIINIIMIINIIHIINIIMIINIIHIISIVFSCLVNPRSFLSVETTPRRIWDNPVSITCDF